MRTLLGPKVEVRIPRQPEYVSVVRMAVGAVASKMDFGFDVLDDIKLAVAEACNNAIEHAVVPEGHPNEITITCCLEQHQLVVIVCDPGIQPPPEKPAAQQALDDLPESGYGLLLIQALMDELAWEPGPSGTTVRMVKRLAR